jgi:serine/threonine protein kinase
MKPISQTKYRIIGLVGRGQFGRVFCARWRRVDQDSDQTANSVLDKNILNKLFALKELDQKRFPTNQFLRELRFLIALRHINIVSCISLDYSQNHRYLVMEYCEAGTLRNLIETKTLISINSQERSLSLNQNLKLVMEILSGLKYAHSQNIVHCDIKPENILLKLTATGWQAKISDFGIARLGQENKSDNTGSPGYMAPERFYGQFSTASDLYAVGVILYELLVKERPFSGNPIELMYAHINQRVKVPDYIPISLKNFILKALEKLPARRFSSAEEMQVDLRIIMAELRELSIEPIGNQLGSNTVSNILDTAHIGFVEKYLSEAIVALGFFDNSINDLSFYCATEFSVEKRNLSAILAFKNSDLKNTYRFNEKITNLAIARNQQFVITTQSIWMITKDFQECKILYTSNQKFYWAIANKWFSILTESEQDSKLQIYYLSKLDSPIILDLPKTSVVGLLVISDRHLALISNTLDGGNISVISRRGNLMASFDLPMSIVMAIASFDRRVVLVTELNYLLLVGWKPYRVTRIELGYKPQLIKATMWGYIFTRYVEFNTQLQFMDDQCNQVGEFGLEGLVVAIACINNNVLVISIKIPDRGSKLVILDLKHLDLDLVF